MRDNESYREIGFRRAKLVVLATTLLAFGLIFFGACGGQSAGTVTPGPTSTMERQESAVLPTGTVETQEPTKTPVAGAETGKSSSTPTIESSGQENTPTPAPKQEAVTKAEPKGDLTQSNSGGGVTIDTTWEGLSNKDELTFDVKMDTHSVDLDKYDLGKLAFLRNDKGDQLTPKVWEAPAGGGHHRGGKLIFSLSDGAGKPFLSSNSKYVELVIQDVAGVKERVFRWDLSI